MRTRGKRPQPPSAARPSPSPPPAGTGPDGPSPTPQDDRLWLRDARLVADYAARHGVAREDAKAYCRDAFSLEPTDEILDHAYAAASQPQRRRGLARLRRERRPSVPEPGAGK